MSANRVYFSLIRQFKSRLLSRSCKATLYKTLIKPVLTYASETWTLTKRDQSSLNIFERKILRRIYGPIKDGNIWRRRYNSELYALYQDVDVVRSIKVSRLHWLGHIQRMDHQSLEKMAVMTDPKGRRAVGRPRLRWLDGVVADCRAVGAWDWRRKALDRQRWLRLIEEAKTHPGLSCQ